MDERSGTGLGWHRHAVQESNNQLLSNEAWRGKSNRVGAGCLSGIEEGKITARSPVRIQVYLRSYQEQDELGLFTSVELGKIN